jgi:Calx-beta domain/RTX calcium-binding nonapeptide repeat (4 copies)
VDIDLFTSNNNALAGSDYSALNTVVSFNSGETMKSVSISIIDDSIVEGNETFNVSISSSNANASITTKSSGITILDNDFNPIYSISPSSNSINEGSSLTTTINTSYVANGTTLYWSLSGNGISASDFSAGSLSDAANTGSDGKIIFSHTLANDLATEGAEILNILLYKDSNRTQQVASTAIFISDTSFTPASTISITGGNNGVANTGTINNNGTINTGTNNTNSGNTTTTSNVSTVNNVTNNYVYYNSNNATTNTNSGNTLSTWNTFWVDNSVKAGDIVNQWFGVETPVALQVQDPTESKLLDITTSSWTEKVKINRVAKASDKGDTIEGKQKDSSSTDIVGSVLTGGKGKDSIQAKAGWDMVDGGDGDDLVKTGNGRDILTGGNGRDELWGGFGWNTYKGDKDGFSDLIVIKSDQHLANPTLGNKSGNNSDGLKTDIIENLDSIDRIIIQGVATNQITFASNATAHGLTGIGIYSKGFIEALYTGGDLTLTQLTAMTTGDASAAVMNNTLTSYGVW